MGGDLEVSCPRCGAGASLALQATDRNRATTTKRFGYWRCDACDVLWLPDVPGDLAAHYPPEYHPTIASEDRERAIAEERWRVELLCRHAEPGRLVEIGPSEGLFTRAAQRAGFDPVAIEMDAACCARLEADGIRAINSVAPQEVLPDLPRSRAIALWHVLEHLPEPWEVLRAIAENLEPGGVLALATPNPQALGFRLLRTRWVHLDAPRHLTLIPLAALRDEAAALGLTLVEVTASDPTGLLLNRLAWERSFLSSPALRPDPRLAYTIGRLWRYVLGTWEARGLRGAAYTALFVKDRDRGPSTDR